MSRTLQNCYNAVLGLSSTISSRSNGDQSLDEAKKTKTEPGTASENNTNKKKVCYATISDVPLEVLREILLIDSYTWPHSKEVLRLARLTCRAWNEIATPLIFKRIKVITHLYFIDRVCQDILKDLQEEGGVFDHVEEVLLDAHSAVNAACMFDQKTEPTSDHIPGVTVPRYTQFNRTKALAQQETKGIWAMFGLLRNVKRITLLVKDNTDEQGDDWATGEALDDLEEMLHAYHPVDSYYMDRKNWHFETPSVLGSIAHGLSLRFPQGVKHLDIIGLNLVNLREGQTEAACEDLAILNDVCSKVMSLWLSFAYHDLEVFQTGDQHAMDMIQEARQDGPANLIRHAQNCEELRIFLYDFLDRDARYENSYVSSNLRLFRGGIPAPACPNVKKLLLCNVRCTTDELLSFLTVHCPLLEHLVLQDMVLMPAASKVESYEQWTTFFKRLKAGTNLTTLVFRQLFNQDNWDVGVNGCVELTDEYVHEGHQPPELYEKTVSWFLDKALDDDMCPLNDLDAKATLGRIGKWERYDGQVVPGLTHNTYNM